MQPPQNYLSDDILENSPVVANCAMNRKRGLRGVNSYEKDLGLDIQELCLNALRQRGCFSWLDICCGEANALYDLSDAFPQNAGKVQLVGIDLVGTFAPERSDTRVSIIEGSFLKWEPNDTFDLIGWQTQDIYQNLSITYISSIRKNEKIENNLFNLPMRN